ncbi:hypothetical protein CEXT_577031 [Caerostris extrusa]|uniref:Uncharacterized protein n=1 Tax=Caerostris extrusa TaxID=172846 RepID=A0AAV4U1T5_CAEEX|nr:hypothetical protein CEXT_577031 [Caerostris extrusa]
MSYLIRASCVQNTSTRKASRTAMSTLTFQMRNYNRQLNSPLLYRSLIGKYQPDNDSNRCLKSDQDCYFNPRYKGKNPDLRCLDDYQRKKLLELLDKRQELFEEK